MIFAAIDIGTNSTRLLISELIESSHQNQNNTPEIKKEGISVKSLKREMRITRLGKNLDSTGKINPENAKKTSLVLQDYHNLINFFDVKKYRVIGTRVLRQAKNAEWFKNHIWDLHGIEIEIISPREEAELSFKGALGMIGPGLLVKKDGSIYKNKYADEASNLYKCEMLDSNGIKRLPVQALQERISNKNILVIDIGGGSTEFIMGNTTDGISFISSINIGSVNISERFTDSSICKPEEIKKMEGFIRKKISDTMLDIEKNLPISIIGLAGTVSTLASIDKKLKKYNMELLNGYILKLDNILKIQEKFYSLNLTERKNIVGLQTERADIIVGGTAVLIEIMRYLELESITVSENDILDGIIYSIF